MGGAIEAKFSALTSWVARQAGSPVVFAGAALIIIAWAAVGPFFGLSDMWQLTVNTATTIITFLMVFIIQNSQNRDAEALQIKIDELIRATMGAQNALLDLENLPQGSLDEFRDHYAKLAEHARAKGFDLRLVIAGMEAEEELSLRKKGRGVPKAGKARKGRLAAALKGT
jgi:low affinity Fe/Cu permease